MNFEQAFARLIEHEGGYVNDRRDPGGETKYGISRRAYPNEDIAGMTLERAHALYRRDYWQPAGCDAVPDALRFDLFDMAVNSGIRPAIRALQRAAGVPDDGILGPQTLQALGSVPPLRTLARFNGQRLDLLTSLATWRAFGRGWARRVAANLMEA